MIGSATSNTRKSKTPGSRWHASMPRGQMVGIAASNKREAQLEEESYLWAHELVHDYPKWKKRDEILLEVDCKKYEIQCMLTAMNIINASSIHCVDNAFCDGHFGSLSLSISVQALSTINWWQRVPLKVRSSISLRWESSTTLLISNCSITLQHGRDLNGRCFVLIAI